MSSAFQGFDKKLNLSENADDRDVLNNLGVAPIADDIALFTNNLRNKSELFVNSDIRQGNTIRFNPLSQRFVFTNGTKIKVFAGQSLIGNYFVGESNSINEFQIYSDANLTQVVFPPAGTDVRYVRSDAILKEDILNLVKPRRPVVELQAFSQIIPPTVTDPVSGSFSSSNIYTSIRRVYSSYQSSGGSSLISITEYMNAIESAIDVFEQKKQKSIVNSINFISENKIKFDGNIIVNDPLGVNVNSISNDSGPGIFILDTTTDIAKRAFSDNENVWIEDPPVSPTALVAATREIVVGNLVFDDGVRIIRKAGLPEIVAESTPDVSNLANTFTHYVRIIVNGEEYSLCLK